MIAQRFLIIANWKANPTPWTALDVNFENLEIAVAAPFSALSKLNAPLIPASQDLSSFTIGPHTGEVPASLLKSLGVKYSLVGHSERRRDESETNAKIEAKMKQAIESGIVPILCAQTLEEIPANIRNFDPNLFMIMYEPSEAISTDGNYHPESPDKINSVLSDWQQKLNLKCRLLYGGSVNVENCQLLVENCPMLSGFVIGHASLDAAEFSRIITTVSRSLPS